MIAQLAFPDHEARAPRLAKALALTTFPRVSLVAPAGLEPELNALDNRGSIHLSYGDTWTSTAPHFNGHLES